MFVLESVRAVTKSEERMSEEKRNGAGDLLRGSLDVLERACTPPRTKGQC